MVVVCLFQSKALYLPTRLMSVQLLLKSFGFTFIIIGKTGIAVGSFYGPPDDLSLSITEIKHKFPHTQIILGGDFNCPGIDWEYGTLRTQAKPKSK